MPNTFTTMPRMSSLSARRAWIEMGKVINVAYTDSVALRKESVDRNYRCRRPCHPRYVALRKESVDRNRCLHVLVFTDFVALRKESVDRNGIAGTYSPGRSVSLSARRAWIEIIEEVSKYVVKDCRSPQGERG